MSNPAPRPVRHVVFHHPGSKWKPGVDFREQDGVGDHVQHYLNFHMQGKLELGGPFLLQDAGRYDGRNEGCLPGGTRGLCRSGPGSSIWPVDVRNPAMADSHGT